MFAGRTRPSLLTALLLSIAVLASACAGNDDEATDTADDTAEDTADGIASEAESAGSSTTSEETASEATTSSTSAPSSTAEDATADTESEASGSGCGTPVDAGLATISFDFEDRQRRYELYVPESYDPDAPTPVVLNWHGLGSTGPQQMGFSEYGPVAEREGFLVVAPTGVPAPGDTRNSWELTDDADPTRDDIAFAGAVIDQLIASTCVDEARIYTTGMSNGGYFSSRLVCELGDRIAAAASIAGLTHPDDCEPVRPVPYIAFHGVDDDVVPFDGGGQSVLAPGLTIELFELVIPDEFAEFAADFGCDLDPTTDAVSELVTSFSYEGCPAGAEAIFYRIDGAGHTWPGSITSAVISEAGGLGVTNSDISATELSWAFFNRHRLP